MDFDYQPLSIEQIANNLGGYKANADAIRIYSSTECTQLQQAYNGGKYLTDPDNGWILRQPGEDIEKWEERKTRLRLSKNPCRLIPDKITSYMCAGQVRITCNDATVQKVVDDAYKNNQWPTLHRRQVERLTSIFGTVVVGPYIHTRTRSIRMRWFRIDEVYPVLNQLEAMDLDALMVVRPWQDFQGSYKHFNEVIDIWTPTERDRITSGYSADDGTPFVKFSDIPEDRINAMGCIPFTKFDARPSADVNTWFSLSDIHEAMETLKLILEQTNSLAEVVRMQGFSTLVIKGNASKKVMPQSPTDALVLEDPESGQSADYIMPGAPILDLSKINEQDYQCAYENEGVPFVIISSEQQPESGVALKIKSKPIVDLVEERKQRRVGAEKELFAMTYLCDQVLGGHVYSWQEAQDEINRIVQETTVEFIQDYNPADEEGDVNIMSGLDSLGVLSPFEKWQRLHPDGTREDWLDWLDEKADQEREMEDRSHRGVQIPFEPDPGDQDEPVGVEIEDADEDAPTEEEETNG